VRLDEKGVVIIGGSSGIGLETARLALVEGASVTIAGRSKDRLRRAAEDLEFSYEDAARTTPSDRLRCVTADMADESSVRSLFAGERHVDHLFLPAGEYRPGAADVLGADLEGLRSILEMRSLGVVHAIRQAGPKMREGGSITLMSGLLSTRPAVGLAMGAAAAAAAEGMTRALALDLAPIRVNAVAPGLIDTPLLDAFGPQREALVARAAKLPVGRIGRPEEVAEAVVFLMTNGFVTGTVLPIDGGGGLV
jgi:NAD(P)-dependent dehydrogenase (short-subunit alcohol dehydrogenase family)